MFGFIKDAVGALTSPLTGALDLVGDALGLPKVLTSSIKAAVGVATGNVLMVADGVSGVMSELAKNPPAKTEYTPPRDPVRAGDGYASEPGGPKHGTQGTHGASAPAPQGDGILEPVVLEYRDALRQLAANFDTLDTYIKGDSKDGKISSLTLFRAEQNERLPKGLRDACRFFLQHPEYRKQLDTAGKGGSVDGVISTKDIQGALAKVNADIAKYGVKGQAPATSTPAPAPAPAPSTSSPATTSSGGSTGSTSAGGASGGANIRAILNDPNLSIEEKLQAIMMALTQNVDNELLQTMDDLAAAQDKRAGIENKEENKKAAADADRNVEFINLRLQKLMEKRKSMFDLMSNMSSKFNEMAKTAINNLRSA